MAAERSRRADTAAVAVLRAIHATPGVERAALGHELRLASGFVTETVTRLARAGLLVERPAPPRGARGRPTTTLHPHPHGPLVVAAAISHECWRLAVVELGGRELSRVERPHHRGQAQVLAEVARELSAVRRRFGSRVRAGALAVPGTVSGTRLVQAANLGWHDVELGGLWARDRAGRPFVVGNDATFAAIAEARRGSARGATSSLHIYLDAGVGGAVVDHGHLLAGAHGMAGEFGHLPLGNPALQCRCGAFGCWNTTVDGAALAGRLGHPVPEDEVSYTRQVIGVVESAALAESSTPAVRSPELDAVCELAESIGRGTAGLVNAFDPDLVSLGGVNRELLAAAGETLHASYLSGLMRHRSAPPPPLVAGAFGDEAPLVGGAEEAMGAVLDEAGIQHWSTR